jgi:phosphatidylserine/phosphatidylglycerophosphate/cardiolipin synthase-like enzyme
MRRIAPVTPEFLGQRDLIRALDDLVESAQKHVVLVSPYVRLGKLRNFGRTIEKALERQVSVALVVRAPDSSSRSWDVLDEQELQRLVKAGLKLFEVPDLHAKVYASESKAILTSINLLESSFNNSIELGVLLHKGTPEYEQLIAMVRREITEHKRPTTPAALTLGFKRGSSPSRTGRTPRAPWVPPLPPRGRSVSEGDDEDEDEDEDEEDEDEDVCFRCGEPGHWAADCDDEDEDEDEDEEDDERY